MGQYRYHMTIPGDMLFFLSVFPAENLRSATWDPKFQAVEVRSRDAPPCCHLPWNISRLLIFELRKRNQNLECWLCSELKA